MGYIDEVSHLAARPWLGDLSHAEGEWLMVCERHEGPALDEEPKMLHSKVHCQELVVKGAVLGLRLVQLFAEEPQRFQGAFDLLMEDGAQRDIGGV